MASMPGRCVARIVPGQFVELLRGHRHWAGECAAIHAALLLRFKTKPMLFNQLIRCRRGAALLEYSLLAAGVSLVAAAGVAMFGHKTTDIIGSVAAILPGAHGDDNGPVASGKLIETTPAGSGVVTVDVDAIVADTNSMRLGDNLGFNNLDSLILEQ